MYVLAAAFCITAVLYASVGFGGGSTYNALLALSGVDYRILPAIALICNIIVVIGGTIRFGRAGLLPWKRALPLLLMSAPFAWLGGLTPIKEATFMLLLAASLAVAGFALLVQRETRFADVAAPRDRVGRMRDLLTGAAVGYLAGLVGIGGGIFLAPYLHFTKWAAPKMVAATASLFILVNSVSGLFGQMLKLAGNNSLPVLGGYWPLAIAVLVGGQIGSHVGIKLLSPQLVRRATAVLILYVAGQLFWKIMQS